MDDAEQVFAPRRIGGIAFVALLHVAIIYALVNGLGAQMVQVLRQPLEAKIIEPARLPPPEAPPPPPPRLVTPPPVFIPPPLIRIAQPPPLVPVIAAVTRVKPTTPPQAPAPSPPAQQTAAGLDPNQSCTPPQYPEEAEDLEQTGVSVLQFLIGTDGHVLNSRIASSSGYGSLDNAALRALEQCKFKPAIGADGNPQESWTSIRYVWQLN
jgi:protein TonB